VSWQGLRFLPRADAPMGPPGADSGASYGRSEFEWREIHVLYCQRFPSRTHQGSRRLEIASNRVFASTHSKFAGLKPGLHSLKI